MNRKQENLEELLATFMGQEHAEKFARDISLGEKLLAENPAPAPSDELVAGIKARIAANTGARRGFTLRSLHYGRLVAAAAVVLLISAAAVMHFRTPPAAEVHYLVSEHANPEFYDSATEHIALITDELDSIENSFYSLYSIETADYQFFTFQEYEADIDELEASLWKG